MYLAVAFSYEVAVHCHKTLSPWDYPWSFGLLQFPWRVARLEVTDSSALLVLHRSPLFVLSSFSQEIAWIILSTIKTSKVCKLVTPAHFFFCHIICQNVRDRRSESCYSALGGTKWLPSPAHSNHEAHAQTKFPYNYSVWILKDCW